MNQLKFDNYLPDCVFVKLHCEPVQTAVSESLLSVPLLMKNIYKNKPNLTRQYLLKLTLRFGEQTEDFSRGAISFGLSRGKLKLELTDVKLLMETVKLTPKFFAEIIVENVRENSEEGEKGVEVKVSGGVTGKQRTVTKNSTKYQDVINQVYLQGTEESPIWTFYAKSANAPEQTTNNLILQGLLQQESLGILEITGNSPRIAAFFRFDNEDIKITKEPATLPQSFRLKNEKRESFYNQSKIIEWVRAKTQSNILSIVEVTL
jgi:hypothetical protein